MHSFIPIAVFAILFSVLANAQTWNDRTYPDPGFGVQFPGEPQVEAASYKTAGGTVVPATVYAVRNENAEYTVMVAELSNTPVDHRGAIDDAVDLLRKTGEIKVDVNARINREFGRELSLVENDGSYSTVGVFLVDHRFYLLRSNVAPSEAATGSGNALRFQQSLRFIGGSNGDGNGPPLGGRGRPPRGRFGPRPLGLGPGAFGPLIP